MYSFEITIKKSFSAAHRVVLPNGELEPLHGHNYTVELSIISYALDKYGMAIEFSEAERILSEIVYGLDNSFLNENPVLNGLVPTAENITKLIFESVQNCLPRGMKVSSVRLNETDNYSITVRKIKNVD